MPDPRTPEQIALLADQAVSNYLGSPHDPNDPVYAEQKMLDEAMRRIITPSHDTGISGLNNSVDITIHLDVTGEYTTPEPTKILDGLWKVIRRILDVYARVSNAGMFAILHLFWNVKWEDWTRLKVNTRAEALDLVWQRFADSGAMDPEAIEEMRKATGPGAIAQWAGPVIMTFLLFTNHMKLLGATATGDFQKKLLRQFTPYGPTMEHLTRLAFLSPQDHNIVREKMKETGMSSEDQNLIFKASLSTLDPSMLKELYLREKITGEQYFSFMRKNGFSDSLSGLISETFDIIPGVSDIFRMVDREAWDEGVVAEYGYDEEFGQVPIEWLNKQGLSEDWSLHFWRAHWKAPSLQQGFEMFHRKELKAPGLEKLFKIHEIPPGWREKLTAIAYRPLTRVDIRRMHDVGVIGVDRVKESYEAYGYSPENAELMTQFTINFNEDEDRTVSRAQIEKFYRSQLINRDTAMTLLRQLGYNEKRADYFLMFQELEEAQEVNDTLIENTHLRYVNRYIEQTDARILLAELDLPGVKIQALLAKWQTELLTKRKFMSKADMEKMVLEGLMTIDIYKDNLIVAGYREGDAIQLAELLKIRLGKKENE